MKHVLILCTVLLGALAVVGCKKTPTDSPVAEPELEGHFIGWGSPSGIDQNVEIAFARNDSGTWSAEITYAGVTTPVAIVSVSEGEDSVSFWYTRGSVNFQLQGVVTSVDILLHVIEPSGQPSYRLYRARDGRNMSGKWTGVMQSDYYPAQTFPNIYLDQAGSIFSGDLEADYIFWHLTGIVDRGAQQADAFYFGGVSTGTYSGYSFRFDGEFVADNAVSGYWTIWSSDFNDSGTFSLNREL